MKRLGLVFALAFPLFACSAQTGVEPDSTLATGEDSLVAASRLRVVHASPDAPAVDVYVRGIDTPVVAALSFTDTSAELRVKSGTYTVDLRASPSTAADPVVFSESLTLGGGLTTVVASGSIGSIEPQDAFRLLPIVERFTPPAAGTATVRIVHASPDAPSVSIDVGDDDIGNPEIANLDRFADTGSGGVALPSGTALQVGIGAGGARQTAFTTPALPEGGRLLVIATGYLSHLPRERDGFGLLAVGPAGTIGFVRQNPVVYAFHGAPDAPPVRLSLPGGPTLVSRLAYGQLSTAVQVPPSDYTLDVSAADADGPPVAQVGTGPLLAGERYLAIAGGFLAPIGGDASFGLSLYRDGFSRGQTEARAIHASPDAPAVDVMVNDENGAPIATLAAGASFSQAGSEVAFPIAQDTLLSVNVLPAGGAAPIATFSAFASPGERSFVLVSGAANPDRKAPLRLISINTNSPAWQANAIDLD